MKNKILIICICFLSIRLSAQTTDKVNVQADPQKKTHQVEASCGQCKFGLPGVGCNLAVRFDGRAYYVKGANIDDYGDAHAHDGFCETIRAAEVQGETKDGIFVVTYFKLVESKVKPK